jgi:hypothetical protein
LEVRAGEGQLAGPEDGGCGYNEHDPGVQTGNPRQSVIQKQAVKRYERQELTIRNAVESETKKAVYQAGAIYEHGFSKSFALRIICG